MPRLKSTGLAAQAVTLEHFMHCLPIVLGGETALLTDEQATVAAIEERFGQLAGSTADDVFLVGWELEQFH